MPSQEWLPWGFVVADDTMKLRPPVTGSIAAASGQLRGCVGMVLMQINEIEVKTKEDVTLATRASDEITMRFLRGDTACAIEAPPLRSPSGTPASVRLDGQRPSPSPSGTPASVHLDGQRG
eukprot:gene17340-biopygen4235